MSRWIGRLVDLVNWIGGVGDWWIWGSVVGGVSGAVGGLGVFGSVEMGIGGVGIWYGLGSVERSMDLANIGEEAVGGIRWNQCRKMKDFGRWPH
jgi:hypothetical protein